MPSFSLLRPLGKIARAVFLVPALSIPAMGQFTQAPGSPIAAGAGPSSIAAADFNGDGIQDLAVANYTTGTVTVLLASPMGEFLPASGSPFTAGIHPVSIAVFVNNGNASLAIANEGSDSITIRLGDGKGGFSNGTDIQLPAGSAPVSVATGNFGGSPGLAVANFAGNTVSLWIADGSGLFSQAQGSPFRVGRNPSCVTIGDFNGDGTPDFAVTNKFDGNVTVYVSNGSLGYGPAPGSPFHLLLQNYPALPSLAYPASIVTGDFNADGMIDLAVANEGTNNVSVLLGNGAGDFGPTPFIGGISPISVGSSPFSIAVGYFNADSFPDLAVVNVGDGTITVLLGTATGAFTAASGGPLAVGIQPESAALGYFNGSGKLGLAVANKGSNTVTIFTTTASGPAVVSAASLIAPVAPGSTVSIFGSGLATTATATGPFPYSLGGSSVTIIDYTGVQTLLPLMSTSAAQINAVIPPTVSAAPISGPVPVPPAILTVYTASGIQLGVLALVPVAPGLFSANGNGKGVANALFAGAQGSASVFLCPGAPGTCVPVPIDLTAGGSLTLFGTGIRNAKNVSVSFGGQTLAASFFGSFGGTLGDHGMDQVNVTLPPNTQLHGLVPVSVTAGGITSNVVIIDVQ